MSRFHLIPADIVREIGYKLPYHEVHNIPELINDETFWKEYAKKRYFYHGPLPKDHNSYRDLVGLMNDVLEALFEKRIYPSTNTLATWFQLDIPFIEIMSVANNPSPRVHDFLLSPIGLLNFGTFHDVSSETLHKLISYYEDQNIAFTEVIRTILEDPSGFFGGRFRYVTDFTPAGRFAYHKLLKLLSRETSYFTPEGIKTVPFDITLYDSLMRIDADETLSNYNWDRVIQECIANLPTNAYYEYFIFS